MSLTLLRKQDYPPSPIDNPRCHSCYFYNGDIDCCEYYLKTGKRHPRPASECNRRIPKSAVVEKKTHPWYFSSGIYDEKIKAAPGVANHRSGERKSLPQ